jgi:hypothetical protein
MWCRSRGRAMWARWGRTYRAQDEDSAGGNVANQCAPVRAAAHGGGGVVSSRRRCGKVAEMTERLSFRASARFYKIPRLLFAPNQEMIRVLEAATGKPCYLMSHAVDTTVFSPELRDRKGSTISHRLCGTAYAGEERAHAGAAGAGAAGAGLSRFSFCSGRGRRGTGMAAAEYAAGGVHGRADGSGACPAHSRISICWPFLRRPIRLGWWCWRRLLRECPRW